MILKVIDVESLTIIFWGTICIESKINKETEKQQNYRMHFKYTMH